MSLRNLLFDIAFNGSAGPIIEMNSATDELRETAMGAMENIEGMESATEELGQTTDGVGRLLQDNWKKVTLAASAAAGAIETMARNQAEMTEQTKRLSASLGIAEDEMRQLAISTSNVTFPLNDVLDLFEIAKQQGLRLEDDIQNFAWFWDTVGDATKESAVELAKGSQGLRAVGIAAGEEENALSAFGYITEHTTSTVSDLLSFLQKTGPELRELGLDIDDTAAIMGILEHEMGMAGRMAISEFTKAVNESDGEMALMLDNLGIAPNVFSDYQSAVDASSDIIQRNADLHAESYTAMQKLQHRVTELNYQYAPFIEMLSGLVPLLLVLGPAMKGISFISGVWGGVMTKGLGASLKLATGAVKGFFTILLTNPITWIVGAIIGFGIALYKLYQTNDEVREQVDRIWGKIETIIGGTIGFLTGLWDKFGDDIMGATNLIWGFITEVIKSALDIIESGLDFFIAVFTGDWEGAWESAKNVVTGVFSFFDNLPSRMLQLGSDIIDGLTKGIKSKISSAGDAVKDVASNIAGGIKGFFGINSPSKLMMEYGVNIGEGLELGIEKSTPDTEKQMSAITEAPLSRSITNNNRSNMTFSPQVEITVGAGTNAREVANSLEREFDLLMERYAKKISLRNPALTEA